MDNGKAWFYKMTNFMLRRKKDYMNKKIKFKVRGNSMFPALCNGDIVIIEITDYYNVNDIVVALIKEMLIIHRVIEINNNLVIMKGDNNASKYYEIANKDFILGKVIHKEYIEKVQ